MTIGIDASKVVDKFKTGTETYTIELIKNFFKLDHKNKYILYTPSPLSERLPNLPANFSNRVIPFGRFWTQIRLSLEMISAKPDLLFIPAHTLPLVFPKKTLVTLHDLGFKHYPELYSSSELFYHNWAMGHSVKHASKIIAISEFTKKDILANYTVDPAKIQVIWQGYDEELYRPAKTNDKTTKPYILFIGRLEEKKNIVGMIKAYGILRKERGIRHQFILGGKPGFGYEKVTAEIEKLPPDIRKDIILPGYLSQEKYVSLLKNASLLFFCTFFEGFGLPPLEAMASGIPVVASSRTSIPEICGKAAMLVDPEKPFEMAAALSKVINDEATRKALISKGLARVTLFSWRKTAEKTLDLLESMSN